MNYTTFKTEEKSGILNVIFDNPPVNIQSTKMLAELDYLASNLENNKNIKVVVFDSNNELFFIAHADIEFLKDMPDKEVPLENIELLYLQKVLNRISNLPQATIAKIKGMCRGGGNEFALACDMRFALNHERVKFMQMEVGMGILPCGGGASRMAKQTGLGRALEIILSAQDFTAKEAEMYGLVNRTLEECEIDGYVENLAIRISQFPSKSIEACKKMVHKSMEVTVDEALKHEAYWLYQCTSKTPAIKRFKTAFDTNFQNDINNQKHFESKLIDIQKIK